MFSLYLVAAALVLAATAIGHAACALAGLLARPAWAPAAGLAALIVIARIGVELPGRATTAAVVAILVAVAALAWSPSRRALAHDVADRATVGVGTLLVTGLPFLTAGRVGILGAGENNDMSAHLTAAWWLATRGVPQPAGSPGDPLIDEGYPLGPHALATTVAHATGVSLSTAFDAVLLAVPVILAVAALSAMPTGAPPAARRLGAALVGLGYLGISYLAQGAFKETILGLLLAAFALALRSLLRSPARPAARSGIPLGILAAGAVYTYSFPGIAWPAGTAALALLAEGVRRRRALAAALRAVVPVALVGGVTTVVLLLPEASRLNTFATSSFANEPVTGHGNLPTAIPAIETLGIWLRSDFRFETRLAGLAGFGQLVAVLALAGALAWWLRRRDPVVPCALAVAAILAWQSWLHRSIYNTAKALAILAPLVALTIAPMLVDAWRRRSEPSSVQARRLERKLDRERGRETPHAPRRARARTHALRLAARAAGVVVAVLAGGSTFLALRDAPVRAPSHGGQLERLAAAIPGRRVLFLGVDDFAQFELRGTRLSVAPLPYAPDITRFGGAKPWGPGGPIDVDDFTSTRLNRFPYLITTAAAYRSATSSGLRVERRTRDFILWRRVAPSPRRTPAERDGAIGRRLDCATASARRAIAAGATAAVIPTPITIEQAEWIPQPASAGVRVTKTIDVPAGRWRVSLQYVGTSGYTLTAPGLRVQLAPTQDRLGSFWRAGTLTQQTSGPLTISITAREPSWLGRLLHAPAHTRAHNSRDNAPLGRLALTRAGVAPRFVPVSRACGRYVDYVQRGG